MNITTPKAIAILAVVILFLGGIAYFALENHFLVSSPIKLGVLFAQSGPMAPMEAPLVEAVLLAVEEINPQGGLLGKKVVTVVVDTATNETRTQKAWKALLAKLYLGWDNAWASPPVPN